MKQRSAALVFACLGFGAATAHAQAEPTAGNSAAEDNAKQLYDAASKRYDLRDYVGAIDGFKKAYALLAEPLFLFDIAQSYRQLHDCENARSFYKSYLRNAPNAENRDKVGHFLDEMEQCVRDAAAQQQTHAPVSTGSHANLRIAGFITAGVGVVGLVAGALFAVDASNYANDLEVACLHGCNAKDVVGIDQSGRNAQTGEEISFVVGGIAAAAGVGMYLWSRRVEPGVTPTAGGAIVTTMVRF